MSNEMKENQTQIKGIYLGNRAESFKSHIESLLKNAKIDAVYIDVLTSPASLQAYGDAYTSQTVDPTNNYQFYEQIGDGICGSFLYNYAYRRFPQLRCAKGVKVSARLKINYGSTEIFYGIAEKLGMWPFISASNDLRQRQMKKLLEDVFEAFIGTTQVLIQDEYDDVGAAYGCCFQILSSIFDKMEMSLNYEDLYDGKTRLKELFDMKTEELGTLQYKTERQNQINYTEAVSTKYGVIGTGKAALQADSQQIAAKFALRNLAKRGIFKKPPAIYAQFSNNNYEAKTTTQQDVLDIIKTKDRINDQFATEGKPKFRPLYTSTVLLKYCKERDYPAIKLCLEMGANPNIPDIDGFYPTDVLLIGRKNSVIVKKTLKRFVSVLGQTGLEKAQRLKIHKNVFDTYYSLYTQDVFDELRNKLEIIEW